MYQWLVFFHILGIFGFLFAHGASTMVSFRLRRERSLERVRALLDLSFTSFNVMYISLLVLLATGIAAGFVGEWWGFGWIWLSLGLLVALTVAMYALASPYYNRVRKAAGQAYFQGMGVNPRLPEPPVSEEEMARLLATSRPYVIAAIGVGGLAVLLWLSFFKPF